MLICGHKDFFLASTALLFLKINIRLFEPGVGGPTGCKSNDPHDARGNLVQHNLVSQCYFKLLKSDPGSEFIF